MEIYIQNMHHHDHFIVINGVNFISYVIMLYITIYIIILCILLLVKYITYEKVFILFHPKFFLYYFIQIFFLNFFLSIFFILFHFIYINITTIYTLYIPYICFSISTTNCIPCVM